MPASGPIIQGSGVRSQAQSAPPATHTANAPAMAPILVRFMARILPVARRERFAPSPARLDVRQTPHWTKG
jgi:hypothetical protein